jgi:integrase/recombinase XerC
LPGNGLDTQVLLIPREGRHIACGFRSIAAAQGPAAPRLQGICAMAHFANVVPWSMVRSRMLNRKTSSTGDGRMVFEEMLDGYQTMRRGKRHRPVSIKTAVALVRFFRSAVSLWPWEWEISTWEMYAAKREVRSGTLKNDRSVIKGFLDYLVRRDWPEICLERFGREPVQICISDNAIEGRGEDDSPSSLVYSDEQLSVLFGYLDERIRVARRGGLLSTCVALRDAAWLKASFAYGLRARENAMFGITDFKAAKDFPEAKQFGIAHIRFGKSRGTSPKSRYVPLVPEFEFIVDVLDQYISYVRPHFPNPNGLANLWLTEFGTPLRSAYMSSRFPILRREAGLPEGLTIHGLRRTFATQLILLDYDLETVKEALGHEFLSTTQHYIHLPPDHIQKVMRRAYKRLFET